MLALVLSALASPWPDLEPLAPSDASPSDAAVVIAIEDYLLLEDIKGAESNARAWRDYLIETRKLPLDRVRSLTGDQATREMILDELEAASRTLGPNGRVWVVFIGHGAPTKDGKDGLLAGWDAQVNARSLVARSVKRSELLDAAGSSAVVVLDACFSGKSADGEALVPDLMHAVPYYAQVPTGVTVMTAGASDEFAGPLPGAERPAFSYLVLGALRGWGDLDANGTVTAEEAVRYAKGTLGALVVDRSQTPQLDGPDLSLSTALESGPDIVSIARPESSEIGTVTRRIRIDLVDVRGGSWTDGDKKKTVEDFRIMSQELSNAQTSELGLECSDYHEHAVTPDPRWPALCTHGEAVAIANALSRNHGLTPAYRLDGDIPVLIEGADGFRLPTPTEWGWAFRGGKSARPDWKAEKRVRTCEWSTTAPCGRRGLSAVGKHAPNELGIYDIYDNADELAWSPGRSLWQKPVILRSKWDYSHQTIAASAFDADKDYQEPGGQGVRFVRPSKDGPDTPSSPRIRDFEPVRVAGSESVLDLWVMPHELTRGQFADLGGQAVPPGDDESCSGHHLSSAHLDAIDPNAPMTCIPPAALFVVANAASARDGLEPVYALGQNADHPVASETNGWRLMTSAEYDHLVGSLDLDPNTLCTRANVPNAEPETSWFDTTYPCTDGYRELAPVRSFPPNRNGLYDLDGNAIEVVVAAHPSDRVELSARGIGWDDRPPHESDWKPDPVYRDLIHLTGVRLVRTAEKEAP